MLPSLLIALAQTEVERFRDYPETDVLAYDIALTLDPEHQSAAGKEHIRIRAQEALESVRLDARESDAWKIEFSSGAKLSYSREADDLVRVALPHPMKAGEEFTLDADFAGKPPDGLY